MPYYKVDKIAKRIGAGDSHFTLRQGPLTYQDAPMKNYAAEAAGGGGNQQPSMTPEEAKEKLEEIKTKLGWEETTGVAREWWEAFEAQNQTNIPTILGLCNELDELGASITDFFLAYVNSNSQSIPEILDYLKKIKASVDSQDSPSATESESAATDYVVDKLHSGEEEKEPQIEFEEQERLYQEQLREEVTAAEQAQREVRRAPPQPIPRERPPMRRKPAAQDIANTEPFDGDSDEEFMRFMNSLSSNKRGGTKSESGTTRAGRETGYEGELLEDDVEVSTIDREINLSVHAESYYEMGKQFLETQKFEDYHTLVNLAEEDSRISAEEIDFLRSLVYEYNN